eukprot:scaffold12319_cov112-Isochrysis_galbana.AAC.4
MSRRLAKTPVWVSHATRTCSAAAPAVAANANAAAQSPARAETRKAADAIRTLAAASTPGTKAVLIAHADAMERA